MKYGIKYPDLWNEAEIQFELHRRLLNLGYDSRIEVIERKNVGAAFGYQKGYRQSRFDCVIFRNKVAICIVEVKKNKESSTTRQMKKYGIYGIPVVVLRGMDDMGRCVEEIENKCRP